jgi:hypothetical protein
MLRRRDICTLILHFSFDVQGIKSEKLLCNDYDRLFSTFLVFTAFYLNFAMAQKRSISIFLFAMHEAFRSRSVLRNSFKDTLTTI